MTTAGTPPALRGAVSTKATGSFAATLNLAGDIIDYTLSYQGLEGNITQAHIHFGQPSTVGGIVVWLCQTDAVAANVPKQIADPKITPVCPNPTDGSVKGTITAAQILEVSAQGFAAREFDELIRALHAGAAYVNIHSVLHPQGEIRGQIQTGGTK